MDDSDCGLHPVTCGHGDGKLSQKCDVVCLAGGVAGEAIAAGLWDSGVTFAAVERELVGVSARTGLRAFQDRASEGRRTRAVVGTQPR
jgi:hypothetical protein